MVYYFLVPMRKMILFISNFNKLYYKIRLIYYHLNDLIISLSILIILEVIIYVIIQYNPNIITDKRYYEVDRVPDFQESIIQWQINHLLNISEDQDVILLGDSS